MEVAKILVVDDEPSILKLLKEALTQWGYQVGCVGTGTEALEAIRTELYDAAITDIRMPEMSGLDLLREIKRHDESIEVIVMTGYPTIASAVEALKEGAYDYLSKPLILDELRHLMARVTERRFLKGEVQSLRARLGEELTVNELVGNAPPMQRVKEIISKVATTDSPVLIEGESGTGKELVAARDPSALRSRQGPLHSGQLQRHSGGPARVRVLRSRPGRVLGRRLRRARPLPRRQRGHDLPGRDRRAVSRSASEAAARAPGDAGAAGRLDEGASGGRARHRGDEPGSRSRRSPTVDSARTCTTG